MVNRDEMLAALRAGECKVTFTKKDGTERDMLCTLKMDAINEQYHPKGGDQGDNPNLDIIKVFDTENAGWRSFRVDSVTNFFS
jgi:hypothetical protein